MDLLAAWLLYPLALTLVCLGLGALVERVAAWRVPGALVLPVGFATLVALARLLTSESAIAEAALPIIGALALAGLVLGRTRLLQSRPDPLLALAALGVFAVYAAPVALSGDPTFAGYLALPDTSHQFSIAEALAEHGPDWTALAVGSDQLSVQQYVASSYPVGAQVALGVTAPLGGLDLAWLYQPFLTFAAVMTALALAVVAAPALRARRQVALAAFVAAQPALMVGFALQGSIKELVVVPFLVVAAALVVTAARERRPARALVAITVPAAAAFAALGPAVAPYLGVLAIGLAATWVPRRRPQDHRRDLVWLGLGLGGLAVLAIPVLKSLGTAIKVNTQTLDAASQLGNLAEPLKLWQILGPWVSGDFRYVPDTAPGVNVVAVAVAALAVIAGLVWLGRSRRREPLLLLATVALPGAYLLARGGPYADGKVMMIASPVVLLVGMIGALSLARGRLRPLGVALTAALTLAVVWSNALAYHDVSNAPHDRYEELLELNDEFAGRGPAVLNEYDEFAKYFLRDVGARSQPEWPHGYRHGPYRPNALLDERRRPSLKTPLDVDDLTTGYVQSVRLLVIRRSAYRSFPPANFRLVRTGRFYEVWQRTPRLRVLAHAPLGRYALIPGDRITAHAAQAAAREAARVGGRLVYARRDPIPVIRPTLSDFSRNWTPYGGYPGAVRTRGAGRLQALVSIPRSGRYRIWVEGSFNRRSALSVDGVALGRLRPGLNNPGAHELVGTASIERGTHQLRIVQPGGDARPGSGGYRSSLRHLGPVGFQPAADARRRLVSVAPAQWRRLVGRRADWLEVVKG